MTKPHPALGPADRDRGELTSARNPRPVVVFAEDAYSDTPPVRGPRPHGVAWRRIMVRNEPEWVEQVRAILDDSASPDYRVVGPGEWCGRGVAL
ncbi:hypothetical protein QJS66_08935 [Kocuria rhizophila]|nr:hypothetical protein QJS66_08935 [Kocuria rhizophila]